MNQQTDTAASAPMLVDEQRYTRKAFNKMFPSVASVATLCRWDAAGIGPEREIIEGRVFYSGRAIREFFATKAVKSEAPKPKGDRHKHLPVAQAKAHAARRKATTSGEPA
jgi:hypothetical protein